jgi:hypothetical protein
MIGLLNFQAIRATTLATAMLATPLAIVAQDTKPGLAQNQQVLESLNMLGAQFKATITTDLGFPEAYVQHWQSAVDTAFAPELLEADFNAAFKTGLTGAVRDAALAFEQSQLGRDVFELSLTSEAVRDDPNALAQTQADLDAAPAAETALLVELFAAQGGAQQTDAVMDVYFPMMITAAEPVIGQEAAEQWMAGASDLRESYARDHFLTFAAVFRQMPTEQLEALVDVLGTPEMEVYAELTTAAFAETLQLAADRLDAAYANDLPN